MTSFAPVSERAGLERLITTILFLGTVLVLGYAFFLVMKPFLAGLAWAAVLAIAMQPLFRKLRKRLAAGRAALLITAGVALAFILPSCFLVVRLAGECIRLAGEFAATGPEQRLRVAQSAQNFWAGLQHRLPVLRGVDPVEVVNTAILNGSKQLTAAAGAFAQNVFAFVALAVLILLALFFLLRDGPALVALLRRLSPLRADITDRLFEEIRVLTEGILTATLLIAVIQGILGGTIALFAGLPSPLIWGAAFGFCSFVPVVGPALVWVPAVLWLFAAGHRGEALAMLLVSVLVIAQVDNVIRPILISGRSRLSLELSMLSVLGGIAAFGMLGLILGPVVVTVLTAVVDVYLDGKEGAPGL
jgi:predicted PurR-regulated permease PerM